MKQTINIKIKTIRYEEVELGDEELYCIERTLKILDQASNACNHPDLRMAFAKMCCELAKFKEEYIDNGFEMGRETVYL